MAVELLKFVVCVLSIFLALGIVCAVWISVRPRRSLTDPYYRPFGDVPGFTREQLEEIARRPPDERKPSPYRSLVLAQRYVLLDGPLSRPVSAGALQRNAGGGRSDVPSGASAVRTFLSSGEQRWN